MLFDKSVINCNESKLIFASAVSCQMSSYLLQFLCHWRNGERQGVKIPDTGLGAGGGEIEMLLIHCMNAIATI